MSVINQMLRDLDERRAPALAPAGTVPVAPMGQNKKPAKTGVLLGVFMGTILLAVAGGGLFWEQIALQFRLASSNAPVAKHAPAPAVPAVALSQPVAQPAALPAPLPPVEKEQTADALPAVITAHPVQPAAVAQKPPVTTVSAPTVSPSPVSKFESALALPKTFAASSTTSPPASPAASAVTPTDPGVRQQQATRDALAQAQTLWNSGNREAAIDLLQQSMDAILRNNATVPASGGNPLLVSVVREWARLQLAEGRASKVWDTLTRLEPQLRTEADLWATRANAAQRLGRHQDSLHAYMVALESRPSEQRWLLGAAVSLAALGKTANASEMVEKARAQGPISREVQTYLAQMGVTIKE